MTSSNDAKATMKAADDPESYRCALESRCRRVSAIASDHGCCMSIILNATDPDFLRSRASLTLREYSQSGRRAGTSPTIAARVG
jgi:hypothetical protein